MQKIGPRSVVSPTLTVLFLLTAAALFIPLAAVPAHSASSDVGTIRVTKSVGHVSLDNKVKVTLTILNNGTVPVFDLEIDEYMNSQLKTEGYILVTQPSGQSRQPVSPNGLASVTQVIVDPPAPNTLNPGQKTTLEYTQVGPSPGNFLIPASLVWFSYDLGGSTIRLSEYSNGLILQIPYAIERAILEVYPIVLSTTAFAVTFTILLRTRDRLAKLKKRRQR